MDLRERLRCMGAGQLDIHKGIEHLKPRPQPVELGPAVVLPGEMVTTAGGSCFVLERSYTLAHRHGDQPLADLLDGETGQAGRLGRDDGLAGLDFHQAAFLDTETSGLAGGTGTYVFLVGVGYFAGNDWRIRQYLMLDPAQEQPFLETVAAGLQGFTGVVTYNGKAFDLPLLETRFVYHRRRPPLAACPHLDLLFPARRLWRERLGDCSLQSLEAAILGVARQENDPPGWLIPNIYFQYLRTGDARPLIPVIEHNRTDVLSLMALTARLAVIFSQSWDRLVSAGLDLFSLGKEFEALGDMAQSLLLYERALASPLTPADMERVQLQMAALLKRLERREDAVSIWRSLVSSGQSRLMVPYVELAKYYEHRAHDLVEALCWAEAGLALARQSRNSRQIEELSHRIERLQRRVRKEIGD